MSATAGGVAVAAPHNLAVDAAAEAVREGGNALDAALAAAALLVVAYPHQCALGGDLTALVRDPDGGVSAVLSLGAAPAAVDAKELRARGEWMPKQGALTVTVPGVVAGWQEVAALGAKLGLHAPLQRAAAAAAEGVAVALGLEHAIAERAEAVAADSGLREVFTTDGEPLLAGAELRQPALAATLEALAQGPSAFYEGEIADSLVSFLAAAGSAMAPGDFSAHAPERPEPLAATGDELKWWAPPPPAQGATLLALLDESDLPLGRARAAQAARANLLGDPRGGPIDVAAMLEPNAVPAAAAAPRGSGDTVAIAAVDGEGRSVALIQSVFQTFGAGILEPRTGIVLHNRGSAFSLEPGHPAEIAPGRRPPHTLCPLLGERGKALATIGCQGGGAQPLILSQVAAAALDPDAALDAVLAKPRWVLGGRELGFEAEAVLAEPGAEAELAAELAAPGAPDLVRGVPHEDRCGHVQMARRTQAGKLEAAADPRADGCSVVTHAPESA